MRTYGKLWAWIPLWWLLVGLPAHAAEDPPPDPPATSVPEASDPEPSSEAKDDADPAPTADPDGSAGDKPVIQADEVVVEARRLIPSTRRGSVAKEVITREEIDAQHPRAVVDLLRERAGVDVRSNGGPGKTTSVFVRGAGPSQVRVLVDGVPVGSSTTGQFDWANLSSHDIDRIEIYRGPQSTIYGNSAMGGVIEIFTRRPEPGIHGSVYGGYGNLGQRRGGLRASGATESGLGVFFAFEHSRIDGVSAFDPGNVFRPDLEVDLFRNTSTSANVTIPTGPGKALLFFRQADAQTELDDFGADNLDFDQQAQQRSFGVDWNLPVADWWTTRLQANQHDDGIDGRDPVFDFNNYEIQSRTRHFSWTNDLAYGDFGLLAGVDLESDLGTNRDAGIRNRARRTGVFGQARYDVDRFGVSAGLRQEWNTITDDEWTYQLGARLALLGGVELVANYGSAFRAPTLNELFFQSPFAAGNPLLEPERSRGGDLGLRFNGEAWDGFRWNAETYVFHNSYEDLIEFRDQGDFFFAPENVETARSSGVEVTFRMDWKAFWVGGDYTFMRARDGDGLSLARRPRHAGRITIGARRGRFRGEIVVHAVGRSYSLAREVDVVDGYWIADFHLDVELHEHLLLKLNLRNLTDHGYQEVGGFGTLPRTYMVSLEARY